jgi:methyl-accepting chemotaxis protein
MASNEELLELINLNTESIKALKNTLESIAPLTTLFSEKIIQNKESVDTLNENLGQSIENIDSIIKAVNNLTEIVSNKLS